MYENDNLFSGIKSVVSGIIITSTPLLIKNTLLPNIVEKTNEATSNLDMGYMLNILCNMLTFVGMMIVILGVFRMVTSFANGGYGRYYDTTPEKDETREDTTENVEDTEDNEKLVSMDEMLLNYREEYLEKCKQQEEEVSKLIEIEKKENKDDDFTFKKIQPKNDVKPQMIKCSFCGRQKEMGSICKRCKTC